MTNRITFGFFWLMFIGVGCNKDSCPSPSSENEFQVKLNGQSWQGVSNGGVSVDSVFDFYVSVFNRQGLLREMLSVGYIPFGIGKYPLVFSKWDRSRILTSYGTSQDDGDVGCDLYYVYPGDSAINFIQVTAIEPNKWAEGTFEFTCLREKGAGGRVCDPSKPDTIRFREGKFKIFFERKY